MSRKSPNREQNKDISEGTQVVDVCCGSWHSHVRNFPYLAGPKYFNLLQFRIGPLYDFALIGRNAIIRIGEGNEFLDIKNVLMICGGSQMERCWGALQPEEFTLIQGVFKRVAKDAWFKDDIVALDKFGLIVLHAYRDGMVEDDRLYEHCREASEKITATDEAH